MSLNVTKYRHAAREELRRVLRNVHGSFISVSTQNLETRAPVTASMTPEVSFAFQALYMVRISCYNVAVFNINPVYFHLFRLSAPLLNRTSSNIRKGYWRRRNQTPKRRRLSSTNIPPFLTTSITCRRFHSTPLTSHARFEILVLSRECWGSASSCRITSA